MDSLAAPPPADLTTPAPASTGGGGHIVVIHNAVDANASADVADVLVQADAVERTLKSLGYKVSRLGCDLNLEELRRKLVELKPELVFNLVEALGGSDRMISAAPLLYESLGLPYTGSPAMALMSTSDKVETKRRLQEASLPTPGWLADGCQARLSFPGRYILKCTAEHASFGLHDDAVVQAKDGDELAVALSRQQERLGRPCFAEGFVDGREFNLSILSSAEGPQVLPPAEIDFSTYPHGKPRIVGYEAKWDESSFEYGHTPRVFDFPAVDRKLLSQLSSLALRAYKLLGLRGYGRIDFRVNAQGQPWILEANCNPCLSPDAGFQAALLKAGLDFDEALRRIVNDANLKPVERPRT